MDYKTLKEQVRYHDTLYYVHAKPLLSDPEYDQLYNQLIALEKSQGYRDYDSPTVKVGGIDHRQGKVKHPNRLYSLDKVYDKQEVPKEFTIETPKLDGACVAIHCNRGKVVSILSRGDGEYGENITSLFEEYNIIKSLNENLTKFEYQGTITIVAEAVTLKEVDNYRNYVAGALNLKDKKEFQERGIFLVAHDVLGVDAPYSERLSYVRSSMLTVLTDKNYLAKIPTDGVVFRTDSLELEHELGYTSKHPKFAVALKTRATETASDNS